MSAELADDGWVFGWLRCGHCAYEWNAMVDNESLVQFGDKVAEIVTGLKAFRAGCPKCGQENNLEEINGE